MVPHAAAESQNPQTFIIIDPVVNVNAAFRRHRQIALIVVALDIEQRTVDHRFQKFQIPVIQIPAGDNEVDASCLLRIVVFSKTLYFFICKNQHLHYVTPTKSQSSLTPAMLTTSPASARSSCFCGMAPSILSHSQFIVIISSLVSLGLSSFRMTPS